MGACGPFLFLRVHFSKCTRTSIVLVCTRYFTKILKNLSCECDRPGVRAYSYDTYILVVCRMEQNYDAVWSLALLLVTGLRPTRCSRVLVWHVLTGRMSYGTKRWRSVVFCTTFSYWGACCSKVLVFIWYIMYVRQDCYLWFFIEMFHSF